MFELVLVHYLKLASLFPTLFSQLVTLTPLKEEFNLLKLVFKAPFQ